MINNTDFISSDIIIFNFLIKTNFVLLIKIDPLDGASIKESKFSKVDLPDPMDQLKSKFYFFKYKIYFIKNFIFLFFNILRC